MANLGIRGTQSEAYKRIKVEFPYGPLIPVEPGELRVHRVRTPREKAANAERQQRRQAEFYAWLGGIKLASGCVDCGYREHPVALQFDHLPHFGKTFRLSQGYAYPRERVLEEIAKCEVVCANCHSIRTFERRAARKGHRAITVTER